MIRNIQLKHSGKYVCMVKTEVDSVASAADLIVRGTFQLQLPWIVFSNFCVLQITETTDIVDYKTQFICDLNYVILPCS